MLFRTRDWMKNKLVFNVCIAMAVFLYIDAEANTVIVPLFLLVLYILSVGSLGYLINDWFDRNEDKSAGRNNLCNTLPSWQIATLAISLSAIAVVPALLMLNPPMPYLLAVAVQIALFVLYSAPLVRLKSRFTGLLADALFSYTLPGLIAVLLSMNASTPDVLCGHIVPVLVLWLFFMGFRSILGHQTKDYETDLKAGVTTFTVNHGIRLSKTLAVMALCAEIVGLLLLAYLSQMFLFAALLNAPVLYIIVEWGIDGDSRKHEYSLSNVTAELNQFYNLYAAIAVAFVCSGTIHWAFAILSIILLLLRLRNELLQLCRKFYHSVLLYLYYKMLGLWKRICKKKT